MRNKKDDTNLLKINSVIIAILCSNNLIFNLLYINGFIYGFYFTTALVAVLFCISISIKNKLNKNEVKSVGIIILLVMLLYFISALTGRIGEINIVSIMGYCILPMCCILLDRDVKKILEYIMLISLFTIPFTEQLFSYQYVTLQQADMSKAYAVLVSVIAAIIHFLWYKKKNSFIIMFCYIVNTYLLIKIIAVGNRGIIVSLAFVVFVILIRKVREYDTTKKAKYRLTILLCICGCFGIYFILNMEYVVVSLYNFFDKNLESTPSFIIKMYKLIVFKSDVSNGRDLLYMFFIDAIAMSPIWGNGMDMSKTLSNGLYPYPHNYILQMFFEGGVIFAIYPVFVSVRMGIQTLFNKMESNETEVFAVFLLCNCIPKLLLSGDIWNQTIFWLWIAYAALNPYKRVEKV